MTRRCDSRSLARVYVYLALFAVAIANDREKCDRAKCAGPLAHYESLRCTPVYKTEGDCCATRYNCNHLKQRSRNKCYVNGKTYELGESLKDEDRDPCDIDCHCTSGSDGVASFNCAAVDCFDSINPGCYRRNSPSECCSGEEICPTNPEDVPTCNVSGKIYKDGDYFDVESDPGLICTCQPGYEGKNIEPFCVRPKRTSCSLDFHSSSNIFDNCAPVYYSNQSPQTGCSVFSRCQNKKDVVIHKDDTKSADNYDDDDVCLFGNMTMHRGDELNQGTSYSSVCVKCVCEVPPVPTCQRLPDNECDVTKHEKFDDF